MDQYTYSCGKAGTAIYFKRSFSTSIHLVDNIDNDRIIGIEIKSKHGLPTFIFCIYMPACNDISLYSDTLSDIKALISLYSTLGSIVLAGDFNAELNTLLSPNFGRKSLLFTEFTNEFNLITVHNTLYGALPTYVHTNSSIDHILIEKSESYRVKRLGFIDKTRILTSDHIPLLLTLDVATPQKQTNIHVSSVAWHKCTPAHIQQYQENIVSCLSTIFTASEISKQTPDFLNNKITAVLLSAARSLPQSTFNPKIKPYWTNEVKSAHARARSLRRIWITKGRPRDPSDPSIRAYKDAKRIFRRTQRQHQELSNNKIYDQLTSAADVDYRFFWRLLRKNNGKLSNVCNKIIVNNKQYEGNNTCDGFKQFFF